MVINYISGLNVKEHSGGWSGMNHYVYNQLASQFKINLADEIHPDYILIDRIFSKMFRVMGGKGIFPAYTEQRLNNLSSQVAGKLNDKAVFNFFHGSTPWLNLKSSIAYGIYLDACFATYMEVYHQKSKFKQNQLNNLYKKEAHFLNNASAVFFSSHWALNDTRKKYGIGGQNFHVAGLGGAIKQESNNVNDRSPYFLFVGLDFYGKGGDKVVEAFIRVNREYPQYHLKIVGQKPPEKFLNHRDIEYEGLINKDTVEGLQRISNIFSNAHCFLLPTSRDLTPLVLVEAGSVGCPVISTDSFGIPEIVINNETGILINSEKPILEQLVDSMKILCSNKELHKRMSRNARHHILDNFTWDKVGDKINNELRNIVNKGSAHA